MKRRAWGVGALGTGFAQHTVVPPVSLWCTGVLTTEAFIADFAHGRVTEIAVNSLARPLAHFNYTIFEQPMYAKDCDSVRFTRQSRCKSGFPSVERIPEVQLSCRRKSGKLHGIGNPT